MAGNRARANTSAWVNMPINQGNMHEVAVAMGGGAAQPVMDYSHEAPALSDQQWATAEQKLKALQRAQGLRDAAAQAPEMSGQSSWPVVQGGY